MKELIEQAKEIMKAKELITFDAPNQPIATVSVWDGAKMNLKKEPVDNVYWDYEADEMYLECISGAGECIMDLPENEQIEICKLIIKKGENNA